MKVLPDTATGTAHGKLILIGEHAVVYNQPAIALPYKEATVQVTISPKDGESTIESSYYSGELDQAPAALLNLLTTLYAIGAYLKISMEEGLHLQIESTIPAERGMGSSAAIATALTRAVFQYFDEELTDALLQKFVTVSEKIAHGNPSGIDTQIVQHDQAIYFLREQEPTMIDYTLDAYLVIADTGERGQTVDTVSDVQQLILKENTLASQLIQQLGTLTEQARAFIENHQLHKLGVTLTKAHHALKTLTVSNDKLDEFVDVAIANGALGAKLTGGGRGGCIIALAETKKQSEKITHALKNVGAKTTRIHYLGEKTNET